MTEQYSRTELLLGSDAMARLRRARVAVFGIGGVGGYVVEALARSGIGALDLIDDDTVSLTNLNRQIIALHTTVGRPKVEVAAERVRQIDPETVVRTYRTFYTPETAGCFDFTQYDYIVDAIDTVTGKLSLVENAAKAGTPIISAMGTGNKLDPTAFVVTDITKTTMCPLARIMRKELRKRGINHLKVVYSTEQAMELDEAMEAEILRDSALEESSERGKFTRRQIPGSTAFVPAAAGLIAAGAVVRDLIAGGAGPDGEVC